MASITVTATEPRAAATAGELQADEAGADHDDLARRLQPLAERLRVGERAELEHAVERRAGHGQGSVSRAHREHQVVVRQRLAAGQGRQAPGAVQAGHALAAPQLQAVLGEEPFRPQPDRVGVGLAGEIGLRQRRPLIRKVRLVAHEDHPALETLLTQGRRDLEPALARADHHDRCRMHHVSVSTPGTPRSR